MNAVKTVRKKEPRDTKIYILCIHLNSKCSKYMIKNYS